MARGGAKKGGNVVALKPKTKAAQPGESGHNSAGLSEEQRRGLMLQGIVELEKLKGKATDANNAVSQQRAKMKKQGFSKDEIDLMLLFRKQPEQKLRAMFADQARMLQYMAHPISAQFSLLDPTEDRTPSIDRAREKGKVAGLEGKKCQPMEIDNYDQASKQGQAWIEGWNEGQAVVLKGFKPLKGMPGAETADGGDVRPRFMKKEGEPVH